MGTDFYISCVSNLILIVMAIEAAVLVVYWRLTGRGVAPSDFMLNLLSGFLLALALRNTLVGADRRWIVATLVFAGIVHAIDLMLRWRRRSV
jgi:hypothetical protein